LFFTKEELSVDIAKKQKQSFLGAEDWVFNLSPSYTYLGGKSGSTFGAGKSNIYGVTTGVDRAIWRTGGRLGFSLESGYSSIEFPAIGTVEEFSHGITMSYTQPLLENFAGRLDRLIYELSDYSIDFTGVQALENQEDFLLDVAIQYMSWVQLAESVRISRERLKLALQMLEQTEKRFRSNLVDRVEVLRSDDEVKRAEQTLLLFESRYRAKQAELAVLAQSDDIKSESPSFPLYSLEELPTLEGASSALKQQSRILNTFDILKEQLLYERGGLVEEKRPELNLTVAGGIFGRNEDLGDSVSELRPDVTVSLLYFTPLGNRSVKAEIEQIDIEIRQLEEDRRNVEINLEARLRNLYIQIVELVDVLSLNKEQLEIAEEKTNEEVKLYNQGRGDLTFVIQSRDSQWISWLAYANNAANYHSLLLQYHALLDELLRPE
jgi:outer membrane protein TolC